MQYGTVPVIHHPEITEASVKAVWCTLCQFARWEKKGNGEPIRSTPGTCFPSVKVIAGYSSTSESTVKRCIRTLERLGFVLVVERRTPKGGRAPNGYELFPKGDAMFHLLPPEPVVKMP